MYRNLYFAVSESCSDQRERRNFLWITANPVQRKLVIHCPTGVKTLFIRSLKTVLLLILASLIIGCNQDSAPEFLEETPFRTPTELNTDEVIIVTCSFYPLELPGHIDITATEFWQNHDALGFKSSLPANFLDQIGFPADILRTWQANGLYVALAEQDSWPRFRQELIALGATSQAQSTALFRNPIDVAKFPVFWFDQPTSLFISDTKGSARGYTLDNGDCAFAVNCILTPQNPLTQPVYINIAPEFHSFEHQSKFDRDNSGKLRRVVETPIVTFENLTLSGTLPQNYFIAIVTKPQPTPAGKLGQLFLTRNEGADRFQLAVIISPSVKTGKMLKNEIE